MVVLVAELTILVIGEYFNLWLKPRRGAFCFLKVITLDKLVFGFNLLLCQFLSYEVCRGAHL